MKRISITNITDLDIEGLESGANDSSKKFKYNANNTQKWLLPHSNFRSYWDMFIFVLIWYNSVVTPIRIFIIQAKKTPQGLVWVDFFCDIIFVVDTIMRFFLPITDVNTDQVITDRKTIRKKYLGSMYFYADTLACVPILKFLISPFLSVDAYNTMTTVFNVLRLSRVLHFPSQINMLKQILLRKGPVNNSVFRMGVILFFYILSISVFGCVYFGLSTLTLSDTCPSSDKFDEVIATAETWMAKDEVITNVMNTVICNNDTDIECNDCPQNLFFSRSAYFLMQTLFTTGYGDAVAPSKSQIEMVLACIFMIFGVFFYGLTIANMSSVLSNLDVVNMKYRHEMDINTRWLSSRSVPKILKDQVDSFFAYLSRKQFGVLDTNLLHDLAPGLLQEFADQRIDYITNIPFFNPELRSLSFLSQVARSLILRIYSPMTYILYPNETQREMIIVKSGRAELCLTVSGKIIGALLPGDYLGDYELLFGCINQLGVRSSSDLVEVLVLTFKEFEKVICRPEFKDFCFNLPEKNYRNSQDKGVLDSKEEAIKRLNKIAASAIHLTERQTQNKIMRMIKETEVTWKKNRIRPTSKFHVYWDILSLVSVMYYSISCPIRLAAFYLQGKLKASFGLTFIADYMFDIFFIFDVYLRLNVFAYISYEYGRKEVVVDQDRMRKHYLGSKRFLVDVFAVIPFDLISLFTGFQAFARISKLARSTQISNIISDLSGHFDECMKITFKQSHSSMLRMLLYTFLMIVWSSVGWIALRPDDTVYQSVYFSLTTLTTVGYGDVVPTNFYQTCYVIFVGAFGAVFTAAIIANVSSFFS